MNSAERLLKVAPWLDRNHKPANTNAKVGDKVQSKTEPKPEPRTRKGCVSARQYYQAQDLDDLYGYVISVDDHLVPANDQRSPLVIGLNNRIPRLDKPEVKGKKKNPTLKNGLIPEKTAA